MNSERSIWLVRHGNRRDFVEPEWCLTAKRPHDAPLSADGAVQALDVARRLAGENISRIFASPFLRAVETACHIGAILGHRVRVEHGLAEMMLLKWFPDTHDFLPVGELAARHPEVDDSYDSVVEPVFPETPEQALARAAKTARILAEQHGGNLLLVTHGGCIRGLCEGILGEPASVFPALCCLIKLVRRNGRWILEADGSDTSHLSQAIQEIRLA